MYNRRMFVNRKITAAEGAKPSSPNVGQYGWTSYETAHYNQMTEMLAECRLILEEVRAIRDSLEKGDNP